MKVCLVVDARVPLTRKIVEELQRLKFPAVCVVNTQIGNSLRFPIYRTLRQLLLVDIQVFSLRACNLFMNRNGNMENGGVHIVAFKSLVVLIFKVKIVT